MNRPLSYSSRLLVIVLATLLLAIAGVEIWFSSHIPDEKKTQGKAIQSVEAASGAFDDFISSFKQTHQNLVSKIEEQLNGNASAENLHELLNTSNALWGSYLKRDDSLFIWNGFVPKEFGKHDSTITPRLTRMYIGQENNATVLEATQIFYAPDSTKYELVTTKKLIQTNVINLGKNTEATTTELLDLDTEFPVHFNYNNQPPEKAIFTTEKQIGTTSVFIYALESDYTLYLKDRAVLAAKMRVALLITFLTAALLFLTSLKQNFDPLHYFLISSASLIAGWALLWLFLPFIGLEIIFGENAIQTELFYLGLNTVLGFCLAILISEFYHSNRPVHNKIAPRFSYLLTITIGLLSSIAINSISISLLRIIAETPLNLNDLNLIPGLSVYLFYAFSGTLWITVAWFTVYLSIFLLRSFQKTEHLTLLSILFGFIAGSFLIFLRFNDVYITWILGISMAFFILLMSIAYFSWTGKLNLKEKSPFRLMISFCVAASILSYIPFYFGQIEWQRNTMEEAAKSFAMENDLEIESITIETLLRLERQLTALEVQSISDNSASLSTTFIANVKQLLESKPAWQAFSFSVQLIDVEGDPISEFTTNLNAPGWTKTFDTFSLEIPFETERIRRNKLRPIIRKSPIEDPPARYTSYRQAWIPFYSSPNSNKRMGWIICSIYLEEPEYRKPLRAVIASQKEQDKYSTFLLNEFRNKKLIRSGLTGNPVEIPHYSVLPDNASSKLQTNSVYTQKAMAADKKIIELYWKESPDRIIKVSTLETTPFNHAFSILRFFFYLLGTLFIASLLIQWKQGLQILGTNKKFKDRLIDRFILASLICLVALIAASHLAISNQSEEMMKDELEGKLAGVSTTFNTSELDSPSETLVLVSTLTNSDAVLFKQEQVYASTAPQIFSQHLLPSVIPWDVFNAITNEGSGLEFRSFVLDDLEFLIGYTPIIKSGVVTNIAAIPIFLKTPTFNEQLLTTVSYLVGLFVVIFSLFILAASIISNRLTSPLEELNEGIQSISDGSLETTLPVKSEDEIGALTNAFNLMVFRLQELRKNLLETEREAAWKEMAQQVAHEIKNPLTPMKLNLQHLDRQIKESHISVDKLKEKVSKINNSMIEQIESLSRIASDFSKFARPMEQELIKLDLNSVLESVANLYYSEKSIELQLDLNKSPLWIMGVKDELQRACINIVKNGIEAIPEKGTITIKSRHAGYKAHIEISDDGQGIPDDNRHPIFVPNFSTKSSGTGLGLAITKKIVEEHGGAISFTSETGKGTTFTMCFDLFSGKNPK